MTAMQHLMHRQSGRRSQNWADGEVEVILGELKHQVIDTLDLTVISPGVPTDLPIVEEMRKAGIPIWGEIELAYVLGKGEVLAITERTGRQQRRRFFVRS